MRIPRVYHPGTLNSGACIELDDNAFNHCIKVLRLGEGAQLVLFNGDGHEYPAELREVSKKRAMASIGESCEPGRESPLRLIVGQSISRGERMDYAIQKATELGVGRICPLFTERCEVRLNQERQEKRQRHWQQIAISACEQSQRCKVTEIEEPQPLSDWLASVDAELKLVLHHHTAEPLGMLPKPASVALLIGPEGGLTEEEVAQALNAGFRPVAFGPRVMRTETAPVAAAAVLQYLWGDLG
ncbi:ribosomal RNA small subunit methyltransferase E [Marinobacterium zhoushanense]|uniref:Ribosomal RNA small subunit methyltransferase E n=1 Tax=Marinobacterium zhoushanense TaxID=1679163 RepID=A0ABQ1KEJ4_9GAMM|nr:16S rRNA (uracil(1498)-N(3))-methyltransferase [Marinobacterium zhoushanense]GGB97648.1 ribosomal RNA small subunit methyltransferase E [Marinobacterium zhoushanense]